VPGVGPFEAAGKIEKKKFFLRGSVKFCLQVHTNQNRRKDEGGGNQGQGE